MLNYTGHIEYNGLVYFPKVLLPSYWYGINDRTVTFFSVFLLKKIALVYVYILMNKPGTVKD